MSSLPNAEVCFLLAFPDTTANPPESPAPICGLKDAPYFQPVDIRVRTLAEKEQHEAEGIPILLTRQIYEQRVQVIEARFSIPDLLSAESTQRCEAIQNQLVVILVPEEQRASGMYEQYVILLVAGLEASPGTFVDENAAALARFIRSQREVFDQGQLDQILVSRIRYSRDELTVVDWEGAVVISPGGDFQSDIELLKIGNYQLLRYRLLDQTLEENLQTIRGDFRQDARRFRPGLTRGRIRRIIQHRLDMVLDFEHTEQNLLLIGDWYTAQLYHAIRDEFYLEEWKKAIKDKLDSLQDIIQTIQENFSLTWTGLLERVELIGWIILLAGYFVLFFMEEIVSKP
jgi:predicted GIY-YIG superfamily endonuclease